MNSQTFLRRFAIMVAAYLLVSCVVHYILLPESYPGPGDFPRHGQTFINPESGESVTFIKDIKVTRIVIQVEFAVEGSVPLAHVHSNMNEVFSGLRQPICSLTAWNTL